MVLAFDSYGVTPPLAGLPNATTVAFWLRSDAAMHIASHDYANPFSIVERPLWLGSHVDGNRRLSGAKIDAFRISRVVRDDAAFVPEQDFVVDADTIHLWTFDEGRARRRRRRARRSPRARGPDLGSALRLPSLRLRSAGVSIDWGHA